LIFVFTAFTIAATAAIGGVAIAAIAVAIAITAPTAITVAITVTAATIITATVLVTDVIAVVAAVASAIAVIRNPVPVDGNHSFAAMYWCKSNPVAQPFIPVIKNTNSHAVAIGYIYGVVRKMFFITKSYLCR
jgi:hypothetical protein